LYQSYPEIALPLAPNETSTRIKNSLKITLQINTSNKAKGYYTSPQQFTHVQALPDQSPSNPSTPSQKKDFIVFTHLGAKHVHLKIGPHSPSAAGLSDASGLSDNKTDPPL